MLTSVIVLIIIGVTLAHMIANAQGTQAFFNGLGHLWGTSINGLLAKGNNA